MPPKDGLEELHRADHFIGILRGEAKRNRIHTAQVLEQQRLALHDRQAGFADRCRPRPSTRVPSDTIAIVLPLLV